ncbi:uncharacterized protein BCR38DRAFT_433337 [Pseudomassariella vexata]|uniref:Uncharacterized protein n=1 Tax=Pseudomassariella vexata TaxID=1141098 RepID=A0A1Y2DX71_9PEZI|nr:uncharacterized protein BCR38DRAFT_433337 [Pseudomassariella vexata]ORY63871.1 hypothetical protein BCR38DRAFT_433337 [Pseudomassariella vexata]
MKTTQTILSLLAVAAAVIAAPTEDNAALDMRADNANWTGGDAEILRRANKFDFCNPGKGECTSGGCWGCQGHTFICQDGPDSGKCCWRDGDSVSCVNV